MWDFLSLDIRLVMRDSVNKRRVVVIWYPVYGEIILRLQPLSLR